MANPIGGTNLLKPFDPLVAFDVGASDNQSVTGDIVLDDTERYAYVMTPTKVR